MKNLVPNPTPTTDIPDPSEPRPAGKRKNTKQWCKGHVGREHQPEIIVDPRYLNWPGKYRSECHALQNWRWTRDKATGEHTRELGEPEVYWTCIHLEVCRECGKHLRFQVPCPDKPENLTQRGF